MNLKRPFSQAELSLFDSEWNFIHKGAPTPTQPCPADTLPSAAVLHPHTPSARDSHACERVNRSLQLPPLVSLGGSFKVEFRADAFNHFVCADFPAHSHWKFEDDSLTPTVYINFGKFGEYMIKFDAAGVTGEGAAKGDASNWRKMERIGNCNTVRHFRTHQCIALPAPCSR